ncbi:MAG TPA: hypothetical protein VG675_09250 [Bryobacteraceae bacterium]|nr:hypothetical protein [Bryobacteraceae bacterium]
MSAHFLLGQQNPAPPAAPAQSAPTSTAPAAQPAPSPAPAPAAQAAAAPASSSEAPEFNPNTPAIGLFSWFSLGGTSLQKGHGALYDAVTNLPFPNKIKLTPDAMLTIPLGHDHQLRVSYFDAKGTGNVTASQDLFLFSTSYNAGDFLNTAYQVQNFKMSLDYVTWPFPVKNSNFRLKTLWQVQYTQITGHTDAPFKPTVDSDGNPLVDSNGNPVIYSDQGSRWFIYPTLGLGVEDRLSRHVRLEAEASGFAIPHHAAIWDAHALAAFRAGHIEFQIGAKGFHYKTSTKQDQYFHGTLRGAFVGLQYYFE